MAGGFFSSAGLLGTPGSSAQVSTTNPYQQGQNAGINMSGLGEQNATFMADMFSQLGTGQAPSYYQKYQSQAMPYWQNYLNQAYYGTPGNRANNGTGGPSGAGQVATQAAMFGLNPKATTGLYSKNQLAFQNANNQLDQYFASLQNQQINQTANNLPTQAVQQQNAWTSMFQPQTSVIPAQSGTTGFIGDYISALAGANMPSFGGGGGGGGGFTTGSDPMNNGFGSFTGPSQGASAAQMAGPMSFAAM